MSLNVASLVSITSTIGLRIASYFTAGGYSGDDNVPVISVIQVSNFVCSFLTNATATLAVSLKAWCVFCKVYHQLLDTDIAMQAASSGAQGWIAKRTEQEYNSRANIVSSRRVRSSLLHF